MCLDIHELTMISLKLVFLLKKKQNTFFVCERQYNLVFKGVGPGAR